MSKLITEFRNAKLQTQLNELTEDDEWDVLESAQAHSQTRIQEARRRRLGR